MGTSPQTPQICVVNTAAIRCQCVTLRMLSRAPAKAPALPRLEDRDAFCSLFLNQESCNRMTFVQRVISIKDDRLVPPANALCFTHSRLHICLTADALPTSNLWTTSDRSLCQNSPEQCNALSVRQNVG
jgi:hypothetical protein